MTIKLSEAEGGDIISFEPDGKRYRVVSCDEEEPNNPVRWVWRCLLVSQNEGKPDGLDRNMFESWEAYELRFTDPSIDEVHIWNDR